MGTTATRIFYALLIAYLVQLGTLSVGSSPTPSFFWSTDDSWPSSQSSTVTTTGQQDGQGQQANTSFSPFFEPEFIGSDELCHPSCDCLDTFFDCKRRELTEFPANFPNWVVTLNISNNEIETIPERRLARLKSLREFTMDTNNLTNIPAANGLDDLVHLSLSRNMISSVEASQLSRFKSLRELDLSRNRIEFLGNHSFPPNSTLHNVNLGANQIETLEPGCFSGLNYLQELSLQRNKIRTIPKDLFLPLKNLERLDLSRNKLETLDSLRFQELKRLHILNLRRNHMSNLSDAAFYGLEKIQHLYLDDNNITTVEKRWLYGLRSLDSLNLSRNEIVRVEDDSWEYMEELQILDISNNQIEDLSKRSMLGLGRLKTLNLSFNKLVSIDPETFAPLEKLEYLDLSNNELSYVLEDMLSPFKGLSSLSFLNLASNRFQSLHPKSLTGLLSLKTLNLSSNAITYISQKSLQDFPSVNLLLYDVRSLSCDCETLWLQSHLAATASLSSKPKLHHRNRSRPRPPPLKIPHGPFCAYPPQNQGKSLMDIPVQELPCSERPLRPVFLQQPKTQTLLMDHSGNLHCNVQSFASTPPTIIWRKNYKSLPFHLVSQLTNLERSLPNNSVQINSTLKLSNVSWSDVGTYQCIAKNHLGTVYSSRANVTVHSFPIFVKTPQNVTVRLGSNAKLECSAKGSPSPEIAFQKDGGENFVAAVERRFHVMPNEDAFIITDVKLADKGVYTCSARNEAGEIKAYATVIVFERPSFSESMEDERAVEGSNAILECPAIGSPPPLISWSKSERTISNTSENSRYQFKDDGALLIIKNVQLEDEGRYECYISNAIGSARDSSYLTVIPSSSSKHLALSLPETIIFIAIAFFCVVGTSAAWCVFFYRIRRKHQMSQLVDSTSLRRHSMAGGGGGGASRYDTSDMDMEENLQTFTSSHHHVGAPLPNYQISKVHCEDDGSQSSSGKDSGTGDDLTVEVEGIGLPDPEEESLMRYSRRKPEMESFSTFGGTRASTARLSQARLDPNGGGGCTGDVISLAHHPGREFLTIPRKYPIPVPPPLVVIPRDHLDVVMMNDVSRSGCQSTTSSSGYSTLGVRTPAPGGLTKNRSHSVNSESESLGGGSGGGGCGGLLQTSGCESGSSTDNLSSKGDRDEDHHSHQSSRIVSRPVSEHLGSFNVLPSNTNSIISAATNNTPGGKGGGGGGGGGSGVILSISTPV